jgi:hypothetical protein
MYYDNYSIVDFKLMHPDTDVIVKPIDNKVKNNSGLITTTIPSIIEHRSDRGEIINDGISTKEIIRYDYSKGIDIELKEGIFTILSISDIICREI